METVVSRKFVGPSCWILVSGCVAIFVYGALLCYEAWLEHDSLVMVIGATFGLAGLLGAIVTPRQRSTVTDTYVEKRRLMTTRVKFDDVKWVRMHLGEMIISDGTRKVTLNRVAEHGRQLFLVASEQLKRRPGIDYRGDPETLAIHFGTSRPPAKES